MTYTVVISNGGPNSAEGVGVIAALPGVTLLSITSSPRTCVTAPVVGCTLGTLAAGASATVTILVRTADRGTITNTAAVNSATTDPTPGNNTAAITLTVSGPPDPQPPPPTPTNCHASYPDFCIPPPPPDLDCANFTQRRFRVLWNVPDPDPHRLDGDRDGIACES